MVDWSKVELFLQNYKIELIIGGVVLLIIVAVVIGVVIWLFLAPTTTSSSSSSSSRSSRSTAASTSTSVPAGTPLTLTGTQYLAEAGIESRYNMGGNQPFYIEVVVGNASATSSGDIIDGVFAGVFNRNISVCFQIGMIGSVMKGHRSSGVGATAVVSASSVSFSGVHTYGFSYDGNTLSLYYDGVQVGFAAASGTNSNAAVPLTVGAGFDSFTPDYFANGEYYSLKIWKSSDKLSNLVGEFDFTNAGGATDFPNLVDGATDVLSLETA
jgi:hypothetical protein